MKAIDRRLSKLEDRLGLAKELFLVVLSDAVKRGLDDDTCVDILREGGFLPTGGLATVDLTQIPGGLNAEDTRAFVRQNGAEICGSRVGGPGTDGDAGRSLGFAVPAEFKVELEHWQEQLSTGVPAIKPARTSTSG